MPMFIINGLDGSKRVITTNPLHLVDAKGRKLNEGEVRKLAYEMAHDMCHPVVGGSKHESENNFSNIIIEMENGNRLVCTPKESKSTNFKSKPKA